MQWIKCYLPAMVFAGAALASANAVSEPVRTNSNDILNTEYNYLLHCGGCHIEDGSGMPPHVPDLRVDMPYFASFTEGRAYIARVPGVVQSPMSDQQLTDVLNMILTRFAPVGSALQPYTVDEVVQYQKEVLLDPQKLRDQLTENRAAVSLLTTHTDTDVKNNTGS